MTIKDVFVGQKVFVTGGSGFLGKVLIEKLLRSCPGVDKIYVLVRERKGKSAEQRLEEIKQSPLFDKARESSPECMKKVVAIAGDVTKLKLGMSDEDWSFLAENVTIIFNAAASVKFDDPLKYAILMNVRGTREATSLALQCKNISVFAHISTTYCNTDKKVVEERLYQAHTDWRVAIKLAEEGDDVLLQSLTARYIDPLPNTYTFAKSLAEHVVNDRCTGKMNTFILRPSVVISMIEDPIRGWVDNMNGPVGLLVAGGKGLLRTIWGDPNTAQDYIPVDIVIRTILLATYKKIIDGTKDTLDIYNCSQYDRRPFNLGRMEDSGRRTIWDSPFSQVLWYPRFSMTRCWYSFYIQVLFLHMLPAVFLDMGLALSGLKKMFVKIQRKIYIANVVLEPFLRNEWLFLHDKAIALDKLVDAQDYDDFTITKYIDMTDEEIYDFYRCSKMGVMKYIFKEEFNQEKCRRNMFRLYVLDMLLRTIIVGLVAWVLFVKMEILQLVCRMIYNYINNLKV